MTRDSSAWHCTVLTSQDEVRPIFGRHAEQTTTRCEALQHQPWVSIMNGPGPTKKNGGHPHGQKTPTNSLAGSIQNHNKQLLRWRSKVLRTSFANTNQLPNTPSHFPTKHGGGSFELIFHPSLEVQYPYQTGPTSTTKSVNDTDVNAVWMRSGSWGQPGKHFFWISCPCYGWFLLEYVGNTASIKHRFIKETEPKTCARHQSRSTSVNKMMIHIYDVSPGEERADWQEWDLHR